MDTEAMESLAQATDRLTASGYRDHFQAEPDGLKAADAGRTYAPEALQVDRLLRFEGPTDPADETMLFALRSPEDGVRGTWVVAYGPGISPADAEMVRRLHRRHRPA